MNCLAYIVRNNIILNKVLLLFYFKILMYKWTDYTLNIKYYILYISKTNVCMQVLYQYSHKHGKENRSIFVHA